MRIAVFALTAGFAGCVMHTAVLQVDDDTYQTGATAAPAAGGISGAQSHALAAANEKCAALGKHIHVVNIETGHEFPVNGTATVTFKCL